MSLVYIRDIKEDWVRELAEKNVKDQGGDINLDINQGDCFQWHKSNECDAFWGRLYESYNQYGYLNLNYVERDYVDVARKSYKKLKIDTYIKLI